MAAKQPEKQIQQLTELLEGCVTYNPLIEAYDQMVAWLSAGNIAVSMPRWADCLAAVCAMMSDQTGSIPQITARQKASRATTMLENYRKTQMAQDLSDPGIPSDVNLDAIEHNRLLLFAQPVLVRELVRESELWLVEPDQDLNIASIALCEASLAAREWDGCEAPEWFQLIAEAVSLIASGNSVQAIDKITSSQAVPTGKLKHLDIQPICQALGQAVSMSAETSETALEIIQIIRQFPKAKKHDLKSYMRVYGMLGDLIVETHRQHSLRLMPSWYPKIVEAQTKFSGGRRVDKRTTGIYAYDDDQTAVDLLQEALTMSQHLTDGTYLGAATVDITSTASLIPSPARERKQTKYIQMWFEKFKSA